MPTKTILILGGGIGGIVTARELRRLLGTHHRVIIIDKNPVHSFPPSYLWVMVGWRKPETIQKPLSMLEKYGIEFHHAAVRNISLEKRTIETDRAILSYDYLVIALGAELVAESILGFSENVHFFYTLESARKLNTSLTTFTGGTVAIVIASLPYKCPPAPYEAALLLESFFARRGTHRTVINVYTPEPSPLFVAGQQAGDMIRQLLRQRGIELHTSHKLVSVDATSQHLVFENNQRPTFDMLIVVPPHRAPEVVRSAGLTNDNGWIPVHAQTLRTQHTNVFALGDVTTIPLANGLPLPKAGVFAHNQAEVVAHNIAQDIHSSGFRKDFGGTGFCFLETGNGRAGYIHGNFFSAPAPDITFHEPSVTYHWGKVVFEKYWLWRWF
ncbi:MAG: NAD(P)/FAD-dependent oxidoreductase [Ignavibacteria bacterium]|nr:NAD(P)/FAD-dependent oxidoreductase [Ignavibacteria bacterium]MBI3766325.1 NAD(P)/FAD-dependent oxidoreductase [Ignavibacteriales bacterium]